MQRPRYDTNSWFDLSSKSAWCPKADFSSDYESRWVPAARQAIPCRISCLLTVRASYVAMAMAMAMASIIAAGAPQSPPPIPDYFGLYALVDGRLAALSGAPLDSTFTQVTINVLRYPRLSSDSLSLLVLQGMSIAFVVFDEAVSDIAPTFEVYKLPYVERRVVQPDPFMQLTGPAFGKSPRATVNPVNKYLLARVEPLKISLLRKPVVGQARMVQIIPSSDFEPGIYGAFWTGVEGDRRVIHAKVFSWNVAEHGERRSCIELMVTGGYGGLLEAHDLELGRPFSLASDNYRLVKCAVSEEAENRMGGSFSAGVATTGGERPGGLPSSGPECTDYAACLRVGVDGLIKGNTPFAIANLKRATELEPGRPDAWEALGRVYAVALDQESAEKAFAKALANGGSLSFRVYIEGWRPRFAVLKVGPTEVSLTDEKNEVLFRAAPKEMAVEKAGRGAPLLAVKDRGFLRVKIAKKDWTLDPVPDGAEECAPEAGYYPCGGRALVQQTWLAAYLGRLVQQLGSQGGSR